MKLVHKHVFSLFRDNAVLTTLQSGFIPGDWFLLFFKLQYHPFIYYLAFQEKLMAV